MTQQAGRGNAGQILETLMKGQTLKYLIFAVLLLNFVQYFLEEAQQASLMLTAESPLLAWTGVFVTTIAVKNPFHRVWDVSLGQLFNVCILFDR